MNNSGLLSPHSIGLETLSPVNSSRRNNLFRDRTTERYGSRGNSEVDRKCSTTSNYRIRKIGPKLLGGDADTDSAAYRGDPTTRSTGFAKQIDTYRGASKDRDAGGAESIWDALGQYIYRQLRNGKGVWVPKLGNFTFTGMNVDLAGSTNPQDRDT